MSEKRVSGFTLIELLVVITIVALLVAVLLPALQGARIKAQMTASLSALRQLGVCQHTYAADFGGYPSPLAVNASGHQWSRVLVQRGYVTDTRIYWSPARTVSPLTHPGYGVTRWAVPDEAELGGTYDVARGPGRIWRLINLDRSMPTPSRFAALLETWQPNTFDANGSDGRAVVQPLNSGGWQNNGSMLFSYNLAVARSYWDGHAIATIDGSDIFWKATGQRSGEFTNTAIADIEFQHAYYRGWTVRWR